MCSGFFPVNKTIAKIIDSPFLTVSSISLMWIKNSSGPKTDTWGTPHAASVKYELRLLILKPVVYDLLRSFLNRNIHYLEIHIPAYSCLGSVVVRTSIRKSTGPDSNSGRDSWRKANPASTFGWLANGYQGKPEEV